MKKLVVIFGGTIGVYLGYFKIFHEIEKKFNCKIRRTGVNSLSCRVEDVEIDFKFCLNPIRDKNYLSLKKFLEEGYLKEVTPLPANELVKKIKNTDGILFFGLCGTFKGRKGDIYFPEEFKEVFFNTYIKHEEISKIKPFNRIKIKNFLAKKIKGKKTRVVTSNLTLMHESMENKCKDNLVILGKILSKHGDVVEKESYQIVKSFKNKIPLGLMLMSSDVLTMKKYIFKTGYDFNPNKKRFNKYCIQSLKIALSNLK